MYILTFLLYFFFIILHIHIRDRPTILCSGIPMVWNKKIILLWCFLPSASLTGVIWTRLWVGELFNAVHVGVNFGMMNLFCTSWRRDGFSNPTRHKSRGITTLLTSPSWGLQLRDGLPAFVFANTQCFQAPIANTHVGSPWLLHRPNGPWHQSRISSCILNLINWWEHCLGVIYRPPSSGHYKFFSN